MLPRGIYNLQPKLYPEGYLAWESPGTVTGNGEDPESRKESRALLHDRRVNMDTRFELFCPLGSSLSVDRISTSYKVLDEDSLL